MTYQQLLTAYRQNTGKDVGTADQNNAFNDWVNQQVVLSGASSPETIPSNFNFANPSAPTNVVPGVPSTGGAVQPPGTVGTFGDLLTPSVSTNTPTASVTTVPNSNYNQVQNANQSGTFGTVGSNQQETSQSQDTTQNTSQNQSTTGTQNTSGTTNQQQTTGGTQNTSGTQATNELTNQEGTKSSVQNTTGLQSTTGTTSNEGITSAIDTLGFGKLLQDAAGDTQASDSARRSFLTDTMETGGSQFGSQVDQAIRNSLSGPRMTGTGDSAQARASGYAAAQIGRNNLDQRLGAAQQLAGGTGLTSLAGAANPFIGQKTNNTGTNTSTTGSTGSTTGTEFSKLLGSNSSFGSNTSSTNNTGFSNLVGSNNQNVTSNQNTNTTGSMTGSQDTTGKSSGYEASTGATAAGSSQAASGQVPQGQPVKTGGCVICTAGLELGLFRTPRALRKAALHKVEVETKKYRSALRGYFKVFTPLARWMLRHPKLAVVGMPVAKAVVYEELRIAGQKLPFRFWPWFHHTGWHNTCHVFSFFTKQTCVVDPVILATAKKHNVLFTLKGEL